MQLIAPQVGTAAATLTMSVDCKTSLEDGTSLVTVSIFDIKGNWCDRRNCWNKEEFRKLCFDSRIPFETAWEEVSELPEIEF